MEHIINIRGTYGSGKTVLARRIMEAYTDRTPHFVEGRKKPLYYTFKHPLGGVPLAVVGSYETVCGGCDTITDSQLVFDLVDSLFNQGFNVLYESLLLTADVGRTQFHFEQMGWPLTIIMLDLPEQLCIDSVNQRRRARGQMEPVNPRNLLAKCGSVRSSCKTLAKAGVPVVATDRDGAFAAIAEILELPDLSLL